MPAVVSRKDGEASFLNPFQNALQGLLDPQPRLAVPARSLQGLLLNRHVGPLRAQEVKGGGVGFRDDIGQHLLCKLKIEDRLKSLGS